MQSNSLKQEGVGEWMVAQMVIPVFNSILITMMTCIHTCNCLTGVLSGQDTFCRNACQGSLAGANDKELGKKADTSLAVKESRPDVGSSRNSTRGLVTRAMPILVRLHCPPAGTRHYLRDAGQNPEDMTALGLAQT